MSMSHITLTAERSLMPNSLLSVDGIDHRSVHADADMDIIHLRLDVNIGRAASEAEEHDEPQDRDRLADISLGIGGISELAAGIDERDLAVS